MLAWAAFLAVPLASQAVALPRGFPFGRWDRCQASIGWEAYANDGPFTLAAVNKSLGVPTQVGVPLHLSPSVSSWSTQQRSLATNETYPAAEFSAFWLVDGGLVGTNNVSTGVGAAARDVGDGRPLRFEVSHSRLSPDPVFCAVVGTSPAGGNPIYPVLALHGDAQHFALCKARSWTGNAPLDVVVYKPTPSRRYQYDYDSCYGVYVQLVTSSP